MTKPTPRRPGAPPGSNNGGGRKKSPRELVRVLRQVYADQLPASGEKIRAALDLYNRIEAARMMEAVEQILNH